jgi:hypothetical protein
MNDQGKLFQLSQVGDNSVGEVVELSQVVFMRARARMRTRVGQQLAATGRPRGTCPTVATCRRDRCTQRTCTCPPCDCNVCLTRTAWAQVATVVIKRKETA